MNICLSFLGSFNTKLFGYSVKYQSVIALTKVRLFQFNFLSQVDRPTQFLALCT